jgi:hypothetical protein
MVYDVCYKPLEEHPLGCGSRVLISIILISAYVKGK